MLIWYFYDGANCKIKVDLAFEVRLTDTKRYQDVGKIKFTKCLLTHSFPMHPFSTPWKHQKTLAQLGLWVHYISDIQKWGNEKPTFMESLLFIIWYFHGAANLQNTNPFSLWISNCEYPLTEIF